MKKLLFGVATFLLLFGFALPQVNAQPVVVPNANEFVEGSGNNSFPFGTGLAIRYQQIYESTQFSQRGLITQLNFRLNGGVVGFNSLTIPDILIQLSTSPNTPATFSNIFANNIGSDVATVFDGALTISAPACAIGPCPFDVMINLERPFNYNPSRGALLLDVTKQANGVVLSHQLDAVNLVPSITRRVANTSDPTAEDGTRDNIGLVTKFIFQPIIRPIPTLSEWGLIAMAGILGLVGFIAIRKRYTTA